MQNKQKIEGNRHAYRQAGRETDEQAEAYRQSDKNRPTEKHETDWLNRQGKKRADGFRREEVRI